MELTTTAARPGLRHRMQQLIYGFFTAQTLHVAVRLRIPDLLADGARDVADLAAATDADAPSLRRLLRALVFLEVLDEPTPGTFALTEQGEVLRADVTGSMRELVLLLSGPESWAAWGHLEHSVRTGEVAWDHVHGRSCFEHLMADPKRQAAFNAAMAEGSRAFVPTLLSAYDFGDLDTVVDVGGGSGALLAGVLAAHPHLRGTVFDTPDGVADAARTVAEQGVADRCRVQAGDFFVSVPPGADAYVLKSVLHDWDDEECVRVLRTVRRAARPDSRVLLVESLMPTTVTTAPSVAQVVMNDLNMMVCHGGRERTVAEFRELLRAAGFRLESVTPCPAPSVVGILEAVPSPAGGPDGS
ncbi:methyltransferase [Micromonospora sp. NPDC047670]|uniref:methyltransferase n=1 Tax=Micromonospora sp. NPDC047670 TaxID=3364252 RepID=UPI00371450C3